MLIENPGIISFDTGSKCSVATNSTTENPRPHPVSVPDRTLTTLHLGRLIVHDRIELEKKVLPKYFNHSSFASLRRQLNYFNFVRVGKGRQRESTYINEYVVSIDDILHLKRRPSGTPAPDPLQVASLDARFGSRQFFEDGYSDTIPSRPPSSKRRRKVKYTTLAEDGGVSPHHVSDDDLSEPKHTEVSIARRQLTPADEDVLEGCSALLGLATKAWS